MKHSTRAMWAIATCLVLGCAVGKRSAMALDFHVGSKGEQPIYSRFPLNQVQNYPTRADAHPPLIKGRVGEGCTFRCRVLSQSPPRLRTCPADVQDLTALLVRDLPGYANRVIQRSRRIARKAETSALYVIVAGRPEFIPLNLKPGEYSSTTSDAVLEQPQQVFFTTLERQYSDGKMFELQNFHWLFLVKTDSGWRLALMYSRFSSSPSVKPATPPQESSRGIMGQAIRVWLKDCNAGAVRSQ
ncbi:MAG: hypothetical protein WBB28_19095 [Crinalium sp.]